MVKNLPTQSITLGGIGYKVTAQDGQVMFAGNDGMNNDSQFYLERAPWDIWYVHIEGLRMIPISHLVAAEKWSSERFGANFQS